jgi:conjugative relaxase-like TrwC/TraI family protein
MRSVHWVTDINYYKRAKDEPPGVWSGGGAKALVLPNIVAFGHLELLSNGFAPDGRPLIQNAGASDHQKAWDLTNSANKFFSVLLSQAKPTLRKTLLDILQDANRSSLDHTNENAVFTRRGKGGLIREKALPIIATFEDLASRELEPNAHCHNVYMNVAAREDGTFGTIVSDLLYKSKLTGGALFQLDMAYLAQTRLGLEIEPHGDSFRIVGVPQKLVDRYSTRSKQIQEKTRTIGSHSAKAKAVAALDTRKEKSETPPTRAELFAHWQEINLAHGFTDEVVQSLLGKAIAPKEPVVLRPCIAKCVEELLESQSYFSEQELIRVVAKKQIGKWVSAAEVVEQVKEYLAVDPEIVYLMPVDHEAQFTTREMWALEKELKAIVEEGKHDRSHVIDRAIVERFLDQRLPLSPQLSEDELIRNKEQRAAVHKLLTSPGNIQVLEGMAGTGKSYVLKIVREILETMGYTVTGAAPSAVVARKLEQDSGIPSATIAKRLLQLNPRKAFSFHHKRQLKRFIRGKKTYAYDGRRFRLGRKTVSVIDEAAMVGTRQMLEWIRHTRKTGGKLLLIGHRAQLQPIDAGAPFTMIADGTDKAELQHVTRQKLEPHDPEPDWHRKAGKLIAAGLAEQALDKFAERGRFTIHPDREQAMFAILQDCAVKGVDDPENNFILAGLNAEVTQLNIRFQDARRKAGKLGNEEVCIGDYKFSTGDVVQFRTNSHLYGVDNGNRGVVVGFNPFGRTMAVKLFASDKTVIIPYRHYTDIHLAHALTSHAVQGATVPNVYVLLGGNMQDRHLSYVQTTRACESTRLYVDKQNAGPQRKHLLKQMARLRPKRMAHDIAQANSSKPADPPPVPANPSPTPTRAKAPEPITPAKYIEGLNRLRQAAGREPLSPEVAKFLAAKMANPSAQPKAEEKSPVKLASSNKLKPQAHTAQKRNPVADTVKPTEHSASSPKGHVENTSPAKATISTPAKSPHSESRESAPGKGMPPGSLRMSQPSQVPAANQQPVSKSDASKSEPTIQQPHIDNAIAEAFVAPSQSVPSLPPLPKIPEPLIPGVEIYQQPSRKEPQSIPPTAQVPSNAIKPAVKPKAIPKAIPKSPAKPKSHPPERDLLDLSHFTIHGTTDPDILQQALAEYGTVPGGIIAEGVAHCGFRIEQLAYDPAQPRCLIINDSLRYDTGLSPEEISLLWHAVLTTGQASQQFGALSQWQAVGIDSDTIVGRTLLEADNANGALVYGYDSQFRLTKSSVPSYKNPFLAELGRVTHLHETTRNVFNSLYDLQPRFFLKVLGTTFSRRDDAELVASGTHITSVLGVVGTGGKVVTDLPQFSSDAPLVKDRFPDIHRAFEHLVGHFGQFARSEPRTARSLAYAEVVLLLRRARADHAALVGQNHVQRLHDSRQRVSIPRLNYTLRSEEFVRAASESARKLARIGSTGFEHIVFGMAGLHYANLTGDASSFSACREKVERCLWPFERADADPNPLPVLRELRRLLPEVRNRLSSMPHDILIDNCLNSAFGASRSVEECRQYLLDAQKRCGDPRKYADMPLGTQCRYLEISSYLLPDLDPVKHFSENRFRNPGSLQPFHALNRVTARRRSGQEMEKAIDQLLKVVDDQAALLGKAKTRWHSSDLRRIVTAHLTVHHATWLLAELRRSPISQAEYLTAIHDHRDSDDRSIRLALLKLIIARLRTLPPREFSVSLLHSRNLFVDSHQLLDDFGFSNEDLLQAAQAKVQVFHSQSTSIGKFVKNMLPAQLSQSAAERWWHDLLKTLSPLPNREASKCGMLLLYELDVRGLTVPRLYEKMQLNSTNNPQAGLFLFDLEAAEELARSAKVSRIFDPQKLFWQPRRF